MPRWLLLGVHLLFVRADWDVSDGRHFKTCSAVDCQVWCNHIPCCQGGRWDKGNCWLQKQQMGSGQPCTGNETQCTFTRGDPNPVEGAATKLDLGKAKLKICFHINQINERGTERATYDYGYFAKRLFGHSAIILTAHNSLLRDLPRQNAVYRRFVRQFGPMRTYNNSQAWISRHGHLGGEGLAEVVHRERCHMLYTLKASDSNCEPVIPEEMLKVPWAVHVIFEAKGVHGTSMAGIGHDVSNQGCANGAVVYHMVYPHENTSSPTPLRNRFGVPEDHVLLCRHGALDTFDVSWVRNEVIPLLDRNPTLHFLLVNTNWPADRTHQRLYHLPTLIADAERRHYFDACDGMLHGRSGGETFGLAVAEMSVHNKPVLTCEICGARQHINILKDKALLYRDARSLDAAVQKLLQMGRKQILQQNWNAYDRFSPARIMQDFNEAFIEPARLYWYRLKMMGITDPFQMSIDQLPPRYNYFWRAYDPSGRLRPSLETIYALQSRTC